MIRVGINGFGTIGKRVADAISLQDDMEVSGVTLTKPSFKAEIALKNGYKLYSAIPGNEGKFGDIRIEGNIKDLMENSDIIVDASPKPFGAENKEKFYLKKGMKAIFQGGEKHHVAGLSFNAQTNFEEAVGKDYVRVVSCNTTGLCRTLNALEQKFGIKSTYAVLIRRSADPHDSKKGPINAIIPETEMPSHHGPDIKTVMPGMDIVTTAVKVPTTIMHLHVLSAELKSPAAADDVIDLLENTTRVKLIEEKMGFSSTAEVMEYARDFGRKRGDLYEIAIWKESINIHNSTLYLMQAVHQESDVVPENVDAIRAMLETATKEESIERTNKALGIE
jgi:glyceraldehyde-3-phosphate dehydrogenase (NAD(P))